MVRLLVKSNPFCEEVSKGALQGIVIVFEAFELQEMLGPLASLAGGRQVGHLDGGGSATRWGARQIFSCRLVVLVQTSGAGVGFHTKGRRERAVISVSFAVQV